MSVFQKYLRWCVVAIVVLCAQYAFSAPQLTVIQDVLYKADGTRFKGTLYITWTNFQTGDGSVPMQGIAVPVVNGAFRTQLIPTTDASPGANYTVRYSSQGRYQFSETWAVPPSAFPLKVRDVRIATGVIVGPPPVITQMLISDIAGLANEMSVRPTRGAGFQPSRAAVINSGGMLDAASGDSSDCIRVDGTSGPCGTSSGGGGGSFTTFVDGETPAGTVDGSNTAFSLQFASSPASSLKLFRNGLLMKNALDYSLNGTAIAFVPLAVPQPGDVITASYRLGDPTSPLSSLTSAQVVCSSTGSSSSSTAPIALGTCTLPPNLLKAGDRVEIRFDYAHSGGSTAFTVQVTWGASTLTSRTGAASDALISGRSGLGVHASGSQWASETWNGQGANTLTIGNAADNISSAIAVRFLANFSGSTSDSITVRNFSVLRYPAQANP